MNKFLALLKVQFLSYFGINKLLLNKKNKNKKAVGVGGLAMLFAVIFTAVVYIYAKMFSAIYVNNVQGFLPVMFALAAVVCLFFTFYSASSALFGCKDYELLVALPLKSSTILSCKLIFMYLSDLLFSLGILIVSTVVCFVELGGVDVQVVIRLMIMAFFLPFFPMAVSIIVGAVFTFISTRFKRRNLIQILLTVLLVVGILALSFKDLGSSDPFVVMYRIYFIMPWVQNGLNGWLDALIFCGTSLISIAAIIGLVSLTYKKLNTAVKTRKTDGKAVVVKRYASKGLFKALVFKEIKTLFSSATYAMNVCVGPVMAIIASVALIVIGQNDPLLIAILPVLAPTLYSFSFFMAPTTNCAISLEGSSYWIVKTMPVPYKTLMSAKLALNVLFGVIPAVALSVVVAILSISFGAGIAISNVAFALLLTLLAGNVGLLLNIYFPNFKWDNVNKVAKQSLAVLLTMLVGMLITGIIGVVTFAIGGDLLFKNVLILIVLAVLTVFTYVFIMKKGEEILNKKS